jgi:hypothetical protein
VYVGPFKNPEVSGSVLPNTHESSSAVPHFSGPLPSTTLTMFRPIVLTISALLLLPFSAHAAVVNARDSAATNCQWVCPSEDIYNYSLTKSSRNDKAHTTDCHYHQDAYCTYNTVRYTPLSLNRP